MIDVVQMHGQFNNMHRKRNIKQAEKTGGNAFKKYKTAASARRAYSYLENRAGGHHLNDKEAMTKKQVSEAAAKKFLDSIGYRYDTAKGITDRCAGKCR